VLVWYGIILIGHFEPQQFFLKIVANNVCAFGLKRRQWTWPCSIGAYTDGSSTLSLAYFSHLWLIGQQVHVVNTVYGLLLSLVVHRSESTQVHFVVYTVFGLLLSLVAHRSESTCCRLHLVYTVFCLFPSLVAHRSNSKRILCVKKTGTVNTRQTVNYFARAEHVKSNWYQLLYRPGAILFVVVFTLSITIGAILVYLLPVNVLA
jgi:hypothetical protein